MAEDENTPTEGQEQKAPAPESAEQATPAADAKPEKPAPSRGSGGGDRGGRGGGRGEGRGEGRGGRSGGRGRGGKRGKRDRDEPESNYNETLIDVYRCSATVKGGRRLSFGALVTVGDGAGKVSIGYGKAKEVPGAIQKAMKKARTELKTVQIVGEGTLPHRIVGRFGASRVIMIPARPGTGLIASAAVKAVLEAAGYTNVLTKSVGSNNTRNVVKAAMNALTTVRSKETVEKLRGVSLSA